MPTSAESLDLVDPVCGAPVHESARLRVAHGGALFCFCSATCRDKFTADPSRFAVSAMLGTVRSIAPPLAPPPQLLEERLTTTANSTSGKPRRSVMLRKPRPVEPPPPVEPDIDSTWMEELAPMEPATVPPDAVAPRAAPEASEPTLIMSRTAAAASEPTLIMSRPMPTTSSPTSPPTMVMSRPASPAVTESRPAPPPQAPTDHAAEKDERRGLAPLVAWRERHFAVTCCREMVKLYRQVATSHPQLSGMDLYRQVVMARAGVDSTAADAMLERTRESFAEWPVPRALNFRDVVHYLAVSEFVATHSQSRWIQSDMKRIVETAVPREL